MIWLSIFCGRLLKVQLKVQLSYLFRLCVNVIIRPTCIQQQQSMQQKQPIAIAIYIGYLLVIVLPTNCVSPSGKHFIPLSLSTCLNSFLTIFHPDPCVLPIQISLPVTRPAGITSNFSSRAFSLSAPCTWNSLPAHIRCIDTLSTFKRHPKFHLFQSAFTV